MKEACIRFFAGVDEFTTNILLSHLDNLIANGFGKIYLLMSTPGGSVYHGLSLYNYLVSAPIELFTFNFGSVDSIGVILYCAGKERFSVEHARFLLHPINANIRANSSMDEKAVDELLKSLKIDQENISKVISATIVQKTPKDIETLIHNRTTWGSSEAKECGLVHTITPLKVPLGGGIISIFNNPQMPQTPTYIGGGENFSAIEQNYSKPINNFTQMSF